MGALNRFLSSAGARLGATAALAVETFRQPVSRRRSFIVLAALLVCLYALSVLWYVLSLPDLGLRCAFTPVISRVCPGFVFIPEGESPPALEGKSIVQLGGYPVETWPNFLRALGELKREPFQEQVAELPADERLTHVQLGGQELVRVRYRGADGEEGVVWCRLGSLPLALLLPSVLWFFLKAGLLVVAALVFWKRPEDRSAALFFVLSLVSFGAYMGGYHWSRIVTQPLLLVVFMVCSVLLPAVSLHFYLIFPRPKAFVEKRRLAALLGVYGPPVLFLLVLLSDWLRVRWLFQAGPAENVGALRVLLAEMLTAIYVYFGVAALWFLACIVCLVHSYATARDAPERNQVKAILCGVLAALVPLGYTLYLAFWEPAEFGGGAATWPMFAASACVTVAFAVSITRYRLMQLDQIITSGVGYFLLSSLAGLVYYAVLFAGALVFSQWMMPSLSQALGVSSAALVLMLVLDWLRAGVKRALDRRFFREKYHLDRTLKRLSLAVEKLVDPPTLAHRLLQGSAELLGVEHGAVYLREAKAPGLYRLAHCLGPPPSLTELSAGCPLVEALQARAAPLLRLRMPPAADEPAQRQLRLLGGEVAHALVHEGQLLALLVLGPKESGAYTPEDVNLVAAFAQITALALIGAEGHRTLEALNRELQAKVEKIAEQQRRILALQSQIRGEGRGERGEANGAKSGETAQTEEKASALSPLPSPLSPGFVGSSPQTQQLLHLVRKVSDSQATVLIRGESGTGKELLARALHEHSPRAGKPFVKVHCAALSSGLLESELFGHVKGAFTGAHRDKVGRFELADAGTLFLDEIGDISLETQTKLLRVLQERTFERVGSSEPIQVNVRMLAATHQDLEELIRAGRFREDLYYRLNVITLRVPPLRERREDVPELAEHFLRLYAGRSARPVTQIDDDALAALKAHPWPGNIRQLENVLEHAVVVAEGPVITLRELPPDIWQGSEAESASGSDVQDLEDEARVPGGGVQAEREERDRREREQLVRALAATAGNKAEAARLLGLARSTLVSRLKKHGLS